MALATVATKSKNTVTQKSTVKATKKTKPITQEIDDSLHASATLYDLLSEQIKGVHTRIDATNTRIDSLEKNFNIRIDATNTRIDSFEKSMSRSFTMLTIVMAFVGFGLALLQIFGS